MWTKGFSFGANRLATTAEAVVPYGLEEESEAGTLIALADEFRLASLKLGARIKILALNLEREKTRPRLHDAALFSGKYLPRVRGDWGIRLFTVRLR